MSFSTAPILIDGKGHLLGRLASIVSKQVSRVGYGFSRIWRKTVAKDGCLNMADESVSGGYVLRMDTGLTY